MQKDEEVGYNMELLQKEKGKIQQERADLLTDLEALVKEKKNLEKKFQQMVSRQVQMAKELAEEKALMEAMVSNQEIFKQRETEKDKQIQELEDQVKDLMFYMDTQTKVEASGLKDEIQGGQLILQEKEKKGRRRR